MAVAFGAAGRRLSALRLNGLATNKWGYLAVPKVTQQMDQRGYVSSCLNSKGEPVSTRKKKEEAVQGCDE